MLHLCIATLIACLWLQVDSSTPGDDQIDPGVHQALASIEASGVDLQTFTADIAYRKDEALLDRSETRTGRVAYQRLPDKQPVLGIRFDTRVLGDRLERVRKRIVFENGWLIEIDEPRQLTIKRQLVHAGETMDPMRLGGPFPLPVGQPKASILKRFKVSFIAPPSHRLFKPIAETSGLVGLRLCPLANTPEADEWSRIDLWHDPATWLPVGVEATQHNGDVRRIRLTSTSRNAPLERLDQGVLVALSPMDDWTVDVRPLPPRAEPATPPTGDAP